MRGGVGMAIPQNFKRLQPRRPHRRNPRKIIHRHGRQITGAARRQQPVHRADTALRSYGCLRHTHPHMLQQRGDVRETPRWRHTVIPILATDL